MSRPCWRRLYRYMHPINPPKRCPAFTAGDRQTGSYDEMLQYNIQTYGASLSCYKNDFRTWKWMFYDTALDLILFYRSCSKPLLLKKACGQSCGKTRWVIHWWCKSALTLDAQDDKEYANVVRSTKLYQGKHGVFYWYITRLAVGSVTSAALCM